ncbi:MAG TPA: sulfite exporter TauE/SafE family protein [Oxalicibacterium sp.]|uniref:sulfite exporter TauE/SafE family protein n=1 Tax=Oxalicibacterium sp. TaxID=2766525 RepID=UPI002B610235|nr:sulfite exporter TauE/SafE family protein [Oxalicibacterium sp.]HWU98634.1 sulfite exporter TauE/SafE family protein [Oxalicibacterium sp.]
MLTHAGLVLISIAIGAMVGAAGVGGFFMPPALTLLMDVTIHEGMATSLFTFIFTGVVGTFYFHRKGSIDWSLAWPLCLGAACTGFLGAWVGHQLSTVTLSLILAAVILIAGVYTLSTVSRCWTLQLPDDARSQQLTMAIIGALTGFLSGLTGIGGPALSVPLMVLCGSSILPAIGVGQVLQIVGALSGSAANLRYGSIDFGLAAFISAFEIVGVLVGGFIVHRVRIVLIKQLVGGLCLIAGCTFILRTL